MLSSYRSPVCLQHVSHNIITALLVSEMTDRPTRTHYIQNEQQEDRTQAIENEETVHDITLRICTAFLVSRNAGGSGALARKSAIMVLTGASSLVCRHNSCTTDTRQH